MLLHNIRERCKEKGITLRQLAISAGLEETGIYKWGDNKPSVDKVAKVAAILETTVDELLKE